MEKEIKINGYTVTFMAFDDDTGNTNNCYIEKGNFSSSLALAEDKGGIEDGEGRFQELPAPTLDKIMDWAIAQGY
jgi:hypothetical protein